MDSDDSFSFQSSASTPKIIGRYQIEQEIGEGNWGKVKRALDVETGKPVAVKIFFRPKLERKIKDGLSRLYHEFELVRSLEHGNVIKYHEIFESGQKVYLVMELGGESLDTVFETQRDRITPSLVRNILRQLLETLVYLASQSVAHHDIKPANLLLDNAGHVILCDFGVAERLDPTTKSAKSFFGTPTFQAPEIAGNISGATYDGSKSDLWSLGVLLYYLVTGTYPFTAETVYLLLKAIEEQPVVLPDDLEPNLHDLLSKMLDKDPELRISPQEALQHPWVTAVPNPKGEEGFFKKKRTSLWKYLKEALSPK